MSFKLEVCCFNLVSCVLAWQAGAHRIELCADPDKGGTTPSYGTIKTAKEKVGIDVYPIIRPRGGDFVYDDNEYRSMKRDILICKDLGCEGIVTGVLQTDGTVDKNRSERLVALAYPMSVTFHRAFDWTEDPFKALEDTIEIGCERILTSGQKRTAMEGIDLIAQLVRVANERIIIMPGSGVRSSNIIELAEKTAASEFHSSARINVESKMEFINPAMEESLQTINADLKEIELLIKNLLVSYSNMHKED